MMQRLNGQKGLLLIMSKFNFTCMQLIWGKISLDSPKLHKVKLSNQLSFQEANVHSTKPEDSLKG